jgi:hypothetical protein
VEGRVLTDVTDSTALKFVRARMIIEFADGSGRYFEAREPEETEVKLLTEDELIEQRYGYRYEQPFVPADLLLAGFAPTPGTRLAGATLRVSSREHLLQIREDSGEIPPELAEKAVPAIDRFVAYRAHPLRMLRPYLARIAGQP